MTNAGCAIQASGLYKIEKAGRRITVDELVAFSQVFGVPVEQLLLPPEAVATEELGMRILKWHNAWRAVYKAEDEAEEAWGELESYVHDHPDLSETLRSMLKVWSTHFWPERDDHDFRVARIMHDLTGDDEWAGEIKKHLDAIVAEHKGE